MGILSNKLNSELQNYIQVFNAIELIARHTKDNHQDVCKYLSKMFFSQEVASYQKTELYDFIVDAEISHDGTFSQTHNILWSVINLDSLQYEESLTLNSFNYTELNGFNDYFWEIHEFLNSLIIQEIGITNDILIKFEKDKSPSKDYDISRFFKKMDEYQLRSLPELPSHLRKIIFKKKSVSVDEASLFFYYKNDDDGFSFSENPHKYDLDFIMDGIEENKLILDDENKITINSLKIFLYKRDNIIKGFNDDLRYIPIEDKEIKKENEQLKAELAQAQERIKQLEAEQYSNQSKQPNLLDLIFDDTVQERYAPDLVLSIKLWEHLYICNPQSTDSHSNRANNWIKDNTSYKDTIAIEAKRLREVTSPFHGWHIGRKNKFNNK